MQCVFDNPIHANTGCIFVNPEVVLQITDEFQGQFIDRFKEYHTQAIREDEEFLILLRAIVEVIEP